MFQIFSYFSSYLKSSIFYSAETDEIRKWTEKPKKGLRSKSLPRGGSEIDEILGSSKTKPQTRLFPVVLTPAPKPVHRQSRVELYENDRKKMRQSAKFSSIKKLFKLGSNPNLSEINQRRNSISSSPMDKEHEREILERERSKLRPEIIHPLDLQSGGVEVVKITPKKGMSTKKSILASLKKEDSGHETSSIHSDSNEANSSNSSEAGGQVIIFCQISRERNFLECNFRKTSILDNGHPKIMTLIIFFLFWPKCIST